MAGQPRITVLLPTHNRADVLGYAIRSVLWQTEPDFELLIVGDGCTDNTAAAVASFDDSRIRWLDLPKAPLSGYANRNVALRQARGDYVAYAQHDDLWFPDHLARMVEVLEAGGAQWGYSRPMWVTPDGLVLPLAVDLTNQDELAFFLTVANYIPSNCVVHRRDALDRVGYWPEDVPAVADWMCWRRIIASGGKRAVDYCPAPTTLHFRSERRRRARTWEHRLAEIVDVAAWPEPWVVAGPPDIPEQVRFFELLAATPSPWIEAIRADAAGIASRLAWTWAVTLNQRERRFTSRSALARQLLSMLFRKSQPGQPRQD